MSVVGLASATFVVGEVLKSAHRIRLGKQPVGVDLKGMLPLLVPVFGSMLIYAVCMRLIRP